jgi:glycosyltransferase involved in cell wall biosynthesis
MHYKLPVVRKQLPSSKTVYDTEALWFRRYDLQLAITGRLPGWAYRYDELGLARQVDLCYAINNEEKTIMNSNGVSNVVILAHALDLHLEGKPFGERSDVLVVGGILEEDSSNEDALWYYLSNAWDKVHEATGASLKVTGKASAPRLRAATNPGLELMGHVDDLVELYETKRIFVAATRFATGIPWKVHEAMAHGIPCVISKLLAHQLGVKDGVEALVADTPAEFVEKSVLLYTNEGLWNSVRLNAYKLIARDCDPENFKKILQTSLDALFGK